MEDGKPIYYITSNGIIIDSSMAPPCCIYVAGANVSINGIEMEGHGGIIKVAFANVSINDVTLDANGEGGFYAVNSNVSVYNSSFLDGDFNSWYSNIDGRSNTFDNCDTYFKWGSVSIEKSIFNGRSVHFEDVSNSNINSSYFDGCYIYLDGRQNNTFAGNVVKGGNFYPYSSFYIYRNSFISPYIPCWSIGSVIWNSSEPINYTYNGSTFTNYVGNYWSGYNGNDSNNDGIGDTPYTICTYYGRAYNDTYPLIQPYAAINAPDLIIESIKINPYPFSSGQRVIINATIKNVGNENVTKPFYVTFYRDSYYIGFAHLNGLAINESKNASITWYAQGGSYDVVVYADAYNSIAEFKEGNNRKSVHISTPMPDLTITNISFPSPEAGERIWVNVSVANIGGGNASSCYVVLKIDDGLIAWRSVALAAESNACVNFSNVWMARYGNHKIEAIIDYLDFIEESNESNNVMEKYISVFDTTPPRIYSVYPYNNSILKKVRQIKLWASDGYGSGIDLSNCSFSITNGSVNNVSMIWNEIVLNASLSEGKHVLNVTIADNEGNKRNYLFNFVIDSTPPSIEVYGVEDGKLYSHPVNPYFVINESNPCCYYARLNGHVFTNNQTIKEDGSYTLFIYARDRAGNVATRTINFSIDNPPLPPPWVSLKLDNNTAILKWAASNSLLKMKLEMLFME